MALFHSNLCITGCPLDYYSINLCPIILRKGRGLLAGEGLLSSFCCYYPFLVFLSALHSWKDGSGDEFLMEWRNASSVSLLFSGCLPWTLQLSWPIWALIAPHTSRVFCVLYSQLLSLATDSDSSLGSSKDLTISFFFLNPRMIGPV